MIALVNAVAKSVLKTTYSTQKNASVYVVSLQARVQHGQLRMVGNNHFGTLQIVNVLAIPTQNCVKKMSFGMIRNAHVLVPLNSVMMKDKNGISQLVSAVVCT